MLLGTVMSRSWWARWKILRGKMRTTPRCRWTTISSMPIPPSQSLCSSSYKRSTWTRTTSITTVLRLEIRKGRNETLDLLFKTFIYQMKCIIFFKACMIVEFSKILSLIISVFCATGSRILPMMLLLFIMWLSWQVEMSRLRNLDLYW